MESKLGKRVLQGKRRKKRRRGESPWTPLGERRNYTGNCPWYSCLRYPRRVQGKKKKAVYHGKYSPNERPPGGRIRGGRRHARSKRFKEMFTLGRGLGGAGSDASGSPKERKRAHDQVKEPEMQMSGGGRGGRKALRKGDTGLESSTKKCYEKKLTGPKPAR